jgi:replicative DNA helicase
MDSVERATVHSYLISFPVCYVVMFNKVKVISLEHREEQVAMRLLSSEHLAKCRSDWGIRSSYKSEHIILYILLVSNCLCTQTIVRYKGKADLQQATTTRAVTEAQLHFFLTSAALRAGGKSK